MTSETDTLRGQLTLVLIGNDSIVSVVSLPVCDTFGYGVFDMWAGEYIRFHNICGDYKSLEALLGMLSFKRIKPAKHTNTHCNRSEPGISQTT